MYDTVGSAVEGTEEGLVREHDLTSAAHSQRRHASDVAAARRGDQDAFIAILQNHDRRLRRIASCLLGDRDLMDDALQEVAVKAARALPALRDPDAVGAWLSRTAYRTCVDMLRRQRGLVLLHPRTFPNPVSAPPTSSTSWLRAMPWHDSLRRSLRSSGSPWCWSTRRASTIAWRPRYWTSPPAHRLAALQGPGSVAPGSLCLPSGGAVMNEHPDTTQRDEEVGRLLDTVELDHGPAYWDRARSATGPQLAKLRRRPLWARRPYQVGVAAAAAAAVVAVVLIGLPSRNGGSPTPANAAQLMLSAMDNGLLNTTTVRGDFSEITTVDAPGHAPAWAEWRGSFAADAAGDSRYEIAFAGRSAGVGVVSRTTRAGPAVPSSDRPNAIWAVLPPARYVSLYDAGAMAVRWAAWNSNGKLVDHGSARRWPTFLWEPAPDDLLQFWVNNLGQAALVQAAVAGTANLPVRAVTYEGRPAWQATIDLRPWYRKAAYFRVLREVVTVDQASGFIVRTVLSATPGPASKTPGFPYALSPYTIELRITHLKTGSTLPAGAFTELPEGVPNPAPSGASVKPSGTPPLTSGTLAQAAASAGFRPLTPDPLPAGFVFSAASSSAHMGIGSMISRFAVSPREVDQLYRRGFEWFELDVCPWNGQNRELEDQDLEALKEVLPPSKLDVVVLHGGSQAGATAYLSQGSFSGDAAPEWFSDHGMLPLAVSSTLELYGKGYCVYLSGNVPSEELLQIANSLHAAGP